MSAYRSKKRRKRIVINSITDNSAQKYNIFLKYATFRQEKAIFYIEKTGVVFFLLFSNFNFSCIYEKKVVPLHDFCTQRDETNYATRQVDETM